MLDRNENLANGEKEDGQDENEQQGAAVQTVSDPRQGDGGVLDTLGFPVRPIPWDEVGIWSDARCNATSG